MRSRSKAQTQVPGTVEADFDNQLWSIAAGLSSAILGPVAGIVKPYRRLIIVSDGSLHYIPFAGLPAPDAVTQSANRIYLVDEHEIVNLPSASILPMLREARSGIPKYARVATIVADPVFSADDPRVQAAGNKEKPEQAQTRDLSFESDDLARSIVDSNEQPVKFPRLLYSRQEADAVAAVLPKKQSYEALDFDASRATVTDPALLNSKILHFATHSFLDPKSRNCPGWFSLSSINRADRRWASLVSKTSLIPLCRSTLLS